LAQDEISGLPAPHRFGTPTAKSVTPPAPPLDLGTPEVGTYVIETSELRLELEDTAPIGSFGSFDASVNIGASVTFAVNKSVAYIRNADGTEHRLRIIKAKKIPKQSR
jgi:hypothetical protein